MPRDKTFFQIQEHLFELDTVKKFISENPDIDIQGLLSLDTSTIRIFFYHNVEGQKIMSSKLINI